MTIIRFLALPEEKRWAEFWDKSTFLEHYVDTGVKYHLYRLHDFYVELTSDGGRGLYNSLAVFRDGPRLEKYMLEDLLFITKTLKIDLS